MKKLYFNLRLATLSIATTIYCSDTFAQIDKINTGLVKITGDIKKIFDSAATVMYAVAGIAALVGAITVYNKWQSADPNTNKIAGAFIGAIIFLVVAATLIKTVFIS